MTDLPGLPSLVVVGAMKCGTTALHHFLGLHPEISTSSLKEVNFFFGPDLPPDTDPGTWWLTGQWHRGPEWYASLFDADAPVRAESSPGYTSPDHPEVAKRMASVLPDVRLVYLVRDPVDRAASQWRHHHRDGAESRHLDEALFDERSQYVARSRFFERISPFLEHFDPSQLLVLSQEQLLRDRRGTLRRVFEHAGADPDYWDSELAHDTLDGTDLRVPDSLRIAFWERVAEDAERLNQLAGEELLRPPVDVSER